MPAPAELQGHIDILWRTSIVGMALVNPDGTIKDANPAFLNVVGYTINQLEGKHFKEITHPADVDADVEMVRRVLAGTEDSYVMRKRYITRTGSSVWIKLVVYPLTRKKDDGEKETYLLYAQVAPIEINSADAVDAGTSANSWTTRDMMRSKQRTELLDWLKWMIAAGAGLALILTGALQDPSDATLISIGVAALAGSGIGAGTERVLKKR